MSEHQQAVTYVGLDVHQASITVALLRPDGDAPVVWTQGHDERGLRSLAKRLAQLLPNPVICCYEAGPCGYGVQRVLTATGLDCRVIAPSLTPVRPGQRVKTDRRDAVKLAELLRAGLLTEVRPPTPEEEAVRDLVRCREQAVEDRTRSRHRLCTWLQRHGLVYQGKNWTPGFRQWLRRLQFEDPVAQAVFDDYLGAVEVVEARVKSLENQLSDVAEREPYREPVAHLRCFKGIDTVIAMTLVSELHGFERFTSPRQLMSYLGLVPSERSSGQSEWRGRITRAGNAHVRRMLVEAAWHYRRRPRDSKALRSRRAGQPVHVVALASKAQVRLHRRFYHLVDRGKPSNKAAIAVARELAGFVWAVLSPLALAAAA